MALQAIGRQPAHRARAAVALRAVHGQLLPPIRRPAEQPVCVPASAGERAPPRQRGPRRSTEPATDCARVMPVPLLFPPPLSPAPCRTRRNVPVGRPRAPTFRRRLLSPRHRPRRLRRPAPGFPPPCPPPSAPRSPISTTRPTAPSGVTAATAGWTRAGESVLCERAAGKRERGRDAAHDAACRDAVSAMTPPPPPPPSHIACAAGVPFAMHRMSRATAGTSPNCKYGLCMGRAQKRSQPLSDGRE